MSYYDEDDYYGPQAVFRTKQRMLQRPEDESAENIQRWKEGIASAKSGDAHAMMKAMVSAAGGAYVFNSKGKPARNPLSRAILALEADPNAWRRFREDCHLLYSRGFSPQGKKTDTTASLPQSVSMVEYLWAANPECLSRAVALHRAQCQEKGQWWSSPAVRRPWEGKPELAALFRSAVERHFDAKMLKRGLLSAGEDVLPRNEALDPVEAAALRKILSEAARAGIEELWSTVERENAIKDRNETVWERGSPGFGVSWNGAEVDLGEGAGTPLLNAIEAIMDEGLAAGRPSADLACRKTTFGLEGESVGSDAKSAGLCRWIKAYPDAEEGLPFSASDWLLPRNLFALCKQAGVSDLSMGRWLAKAGAHWQAPSNLNYAGNLTQGYPSWSYKSRTNESKTIGLGMGQWTVLEWALFTCPEAALEACLHGARLATGTEDFLRSRADQSDSFRDRSVDYAKAHVWAEACRVAESSFKSSKGPAKRKSMSI